MIPISRPPSFPVDRPAAALHAGHLAQGPEVAAFEAALGARLTHRLSLDPAVVTSSGSTALHLAAAALGIGKGWIVTVPACTYVATANAIAQTGAKVRLVDIDPDTWLMADDPKADASVRVDLYGERDRRPVTTLTIRDAAQSFGPAQPFDADLVTASFFANKILTTGEGGAVWAADPWIDRQIRLLRGHGTDLARGRYAHVALGYNYRLSALACAVGLAQMDGLDARLDRRRAIWRRYDAALEPLGFRLQYRSVNATPWLWTARVPEGASAAALGQRLAQRGVETRPVFPALTGFGWLGRQDPCPEAERLAREGISLPTFADLTDDEQTQVIDAVTEVYRG